MAVSHQWFMQWTPPSMVFVDISRQFDHVNTNWKETIDNVNPNWKEQIDNVNPNWKEPIDNVNPNWEEYSNNANSKRKEPIENSNLNGKEPDWNQRGTKSDSDVNNNYPYSVHEQSFENYDYGKQEEVKNNERARAAGVTLWLTMLGLARAQSIPADTDTPPFVTLYKWKTIDFEFPSPRFRRHALTTGRYVPENVLPLGIEVWDSRVFVTLPSWRKGVPATLATVPRSGGLTSPPLKPYPNWSYHRVFSKDKNCTGLISVFRINFDPCGRLWVLDSGQIDAQDAPKQICPPSVVVFDVRTDKIIARYPIPQKYVFENSLFSTIVIDTRMRDCSDLHLYIADTWRFGLLVFREHDAKFWRFSHHLFYPDPLASNYTLHGLNFQWTDGIFGLALSPIDSIQHRILFFHSMSSYREFYVSTKIIQDPLRVSDSVTKFHIVGESRGFHGQSSASAVDRQGVMFYGLVSRDSIGCWDIGKQYKKTTSGIVATNSETLVFPNDVKVDQDASQSVWVISNRLPMFQERSLDLDDYNFRIMYADTKEAVKGTVCDPEIPPPSTAYWP